LRGSELLQGVLKPTTGFYATIYEDKQNEHAISDIFLLILVQHPIFFYGLFLVLLPIYDVL
jgi:hypothetical protein